MSANVSAAYMKKQARERAHQSSMEWGRYVRFHNNTPELRCKSPTIGPRIAMGISEWESGLDWIDEHTCLQISRLHSQQSIRVRSVIRYEFIDYGKVADYIRDRDLEYSQYTKAVFAGISQSAYSRVIVDWKDAVSQIVG